ncbi:MAG: YdeI/OmpD-associated family protein [Candidatus Dormibacteraceae bacterium]
MADPAQSQVAILVLGPRLDTPAAPRVQLRWMETRYFATPSEFRAWLVENHATAKEVGVVLHSRASGKPTMTWSDAVDQALCFGWIDSIARKLDETSRVQRFTPRKPKSNWSAVNIRKVSMLTERGLMTPAGDAAFARREEARSGVYSYENRHLAALDFEREAIFRADAGAWEFFSTQPPSYRQTAIYWVMNAKRDETRSTRLARLIARSAARLRL